MACAAQRNQVRIRSDGLFIKGKYSLAKIFVMNSHFAISACLNRYCCFSFFLGGGGGGGGEGEEEGEEDPLYCCLCAVFFGNRYQILFFLYTSPTELTQSLCKVK